MSDNEPTMAHMDGSPAEVSLPYIRVVFQHGPPHEVGVNGCRVEDLVDVLIDKLLDFQGRALACDENATALHHLTLAKKALSDRRQHREQQGVYGADARHVSGDS
ncbi:MAG: hypothetical protein JSS66_11380 [Armatimonadetes bacterium]|nr:hypothetical protein [Armatimonadota bacterium]